jgi:hypothetical protein
MRRCIAVSALVAGLLGFVAPQPAAALSCGPGDVGSIDTSCSGLWQERNRVYAEAGYCFKTERAIRVFGRRCFPPYGKLSHDDACYVQALQQMERAKGCSGD